MNIPNQDDMLGKVQMYQSIVLAYEKLNDDINKLLMESSGGTENMSNDDLAHYRALARQRDEALNEMRFWEQQLLDEEDTAE
jgi:hypothetical protein